MYKENLFLKSLSRYSDQEVYVISCRLITSKFIRDVDILYKNGEIPKLHATFNPTALMPMIRKIQENWQLDD
jgi:tRNA/tmRNA/rRNA uracil-C5-methylase (TrmA/RlmC/RlmD family)